MTPTAPDITSAQTLPQLLACRAALTPHAEAYRAFDASQHAWVSLTWAQTTERVHTWAQALTALQTFLPAERTAHNLSVAADLHYSIGLTHLRQRQNALARAAFEQALSAAQLAAVPQQIEAIRQHLAQVGE